MKLPATPTADGLTWTLAHGAATWDARRRLWRRPGLDGPMAVPASEIELTPTLGEGPAVAHLTATQAVGPLETVTLVVAWPVVLVALGDARPFDRFRPGLRATLLGDPADGQVLPAAVTPTVTGPLPLDRAALRLVLTNATPTTAVVRRVAFPEDALTLWADGASLHAGTVAVRLVDDHAEAVVRAPDVPVHGRLLRAGKDGSRSSALLGWVESHRSLGFAL